MSDEKYPLIETGREEDSLFFSHEFSESDDRDQACVGHLRGDFGSSGAEFWTSWWDHHEELKDQEFMDELDGVVNSLRKDGPLKDFLSMQRFCWEHSQTQMSPQYGSENYGLRVDTAKHRFYLRLCPMHGNYNFYIYCYKAELLKMPIRVLVVEPRKLCEARGICGMREMQGIVGGDIEEVNPFPEAVAVICNAKGRMLGLPVNRPLLDKDGLPYDIIHGTFFIAGINEGEYVSLTDEQIQKYKELYDHVLAVAPRETPHSEKSDQKKKAAKGRSGAER